MDLPELSTLTYVLVIGGFLIVIAPPLLGFLWRCVKWIGTFMAILFGWGLGIPIAIAWKGKKIGSLHYFKFTRKS